MLYKVEPQKRCDTIGPCCPADGQPEKPHYPCVTIPINKKMAMAISAGKKITITLTGEVEMVKVVDSAEQRDWDRTELRMDVRSVETALSESDYEALTKSYEED